MNGFNINEFKSKVNQGVMRNNKFLVQIPMPNSILLNNNSTERQTLVASNRDLSFYCDSTSIPGMALLVNEVRNFGYGPVEKKPYNAVFTDLSLTFISDGPGENLKFFQEWLRSIVNYDMRETMTGRNSTYDLAPYELNYKTDYAVEMKIYVYNEQGEETIKLTLADAYPIFVGDIALNWADTNNFARVPVNFTFMTWWNEKVSYLPSTE